MQPARRSSALIRFGVFEADVFSCELRKNGVKVKIQDLPFRALRLLLSHPNEVLSRDQFRRGTLAGRRIRRLRSRHQQRHQPPPGCLRRLRRQSRFHRNRRAPRLPLDRSYPRPGTVAAFRPAPCWSKPSRTSSEEDDAGGEPMEMATALASRRLASGTLDFLANSPLG